MTKLLLTFLHFFLLIFLPQSYASLRNEEKALLKFAKQVPHGQKLNWTSAAPICISWAGITCNSENNSITAVRLPGVGLKGSIPKNTLGKLTNLMILSLRSNLLTGSLPSDLLSLPSLQYVYLQKNSLSGNIPPSLSPQLNTIDLSFNSLDGEIPSSIQNLTNLDKLFLQNNSLTGLIPVLNVTSLKHLNVSNNHLNGSIPSTLIGFPTSTFKGNIGLCGPPLKHCPGISPSPSPSPSFSSPSPSPSPSPSFSSPSPLPWSFVLPSPPRKEVSKKSLSDGGIIGISVGGAVLLFLLVIIFFCCLRKKDSEGTGAVKGKACSAGRTEKTKENFGTGVQDAEKNKLVFFEGSFINFDLEDLLRASAEVLGKGNYGTTYKATLEDGKTMVVKRLKDVFVGKREFEQQMEMIGGVSQHSNVVPLRAYYHSKDEKLLVYDYVAAGSLLAHLHGMPLIIFSLLSYKFLHKTESNIS